MGEHIPGKSKNTQANQLEVQLSKKNPTPCFLLGGYKKVKRSAKNKTWNKTHTHMLGFPIGPAEATLRSQKQKKGK